jgi:hypothetical protein
VTSKQGNGTEDRKADQEYFDNEMVKNRKALRHKLKDIKTPINGYRELLQSAHSLLQRVQGHRRFDSGGRRTSLKKAAPQSCGRV